MNNKLTELKNLKNMCETMLKSENIDKSLKTRY